MSGNALAARDMRSAAVIAVRNGKTMARVTLNTGATFAFSIADVADDGLVGNRPETPGTPALIPMHAISMIEFTA